VLVKLPVGVLAVVVLKPMRRRVTAWAEPPRTGEGRPGYVFLRGKEIFGEIVSHAAGLFASRQPL